MADHVVSLNNKQENAAVAIVDAINHPIGSSEVGTLTVDQWCKDVVVAPIKERIRAEDAARLAAITSALPNATNQQLNQINAILGLA